jgi:hypothetical protein
MKTITICGKEYELTSERTSRIVDAMIETQRKMDKEMAYPEDLRSYSTIVFYRTHIAKLEAMLS